MPEDECFKLIMKEVERLRKSGKAREIRVIYDGNGATIVINDLMVTSYDCRWLLLHAKLVRNYFTQQRQ